MIYVYIVTPFQVRHKLNYFLIFQKNWILIVSYEENFKNSCNQPNLIPNLFFKWLTIVTY
jgi:hypothetical protein